jgi:gas vesicle protein
MAYAGKVGHPRVTHQLPKSRPAGALATGLTIGLLVGAGMALLFAPQRGSETRRDLGRGLRRVRTRGRDAWDDLRDELWHARRRLVRARRRKRLEADEREAVAT